MDVLSRRGFTLVELLVSVAIIALLVGILLPTLSSARRSSRTLICLSQLRQIGVATALYANDHDELLPRSSHSGLAFDVLPWGYALLPYLGHGVYTGPGPAWASAFNGIYRCPEDERRVPWSYGKNVWFELTAEETGEIEGVARGPTFPKISSVRRASVTILFGELASSSMADHIMAHFYHLGGSPEVDGRRHRVGSNYLFVDGHAETALFESTFKLPDIDRWHPGRAR